MCAVPAGDRTLLATGGEDRTVRLWDLADGSLIRTLEGHEEILNALCAVPAGDQILLAAAHGDIVGRRELYNSGIQPRAL